MTQWRLRALTRVDEPPAILDGDRGRHLDERMLALLQRPEAHRDMPGPRRGDVGDIDVRRVRPIAPRLFVPLLGRPGALPPGADRTDWRRPLRDPADVTDGDDVDELDPEAGAHMGEPPCQADTPIRTALERLRRERVNGPLSGGRGGTPPKSGITGGAAGWAGRERRRRVTVRRHASAEVFRKPRRDRSRHSCWDGV